MIKIPKSCTYGLDHSLAVRNKSLMVIATSLKPLVQI